jgi:hypothetical protein
VPKGPTRKMMIFGWVIDESSVDMVPWAEVQLGFPQARHVADRGTLQTDAKVLSFIATWVYDVVFISSRGTADGDTVLHMVRSLGSRLQQGCHAQFGS